MADAPFRYTVLEDSDLTTTRGAGSSSSPSATSTSNSTNSTSDATPTSENPQETTLSRSGRSSSNVLAPALGASLGALAMGIIILLLFCLRRRRRRQQEALPANNKDLKNATSFASTAQPSTLDHPLGLNGNAGYVVEPLPPVPVDWDYTNPRASQRSLSRAAGIASLAENSQRPYSQGSSSGKEPTRLSYVDDSRAQYYVRTSILAPLSLTDSPPPEHYRRG